LPIYLNFSNWENDFKSLYEVVGLCSDKNLIVIGDLNGRISGEQNIHDLSRFSNNVKIKDYRKSKDAILNVKGRNILEMCEDYGLIIMNGRVEGDQEGEFTFLSSVGASAIDLALVSVNCLDLICDFKVGSFIGSDHLPINLMLNVNLEGDSGGINDLVLPLLPRLKWTRQDSLNYKVKSGEGASEIDLTDNEEENLGAILGCIKSAASLKQGALSGNVNTINKKQIWFDYECLASRRRVFKCLNAFRKSNSRHHREGYIKANRDYKRLLKSKKKAYFDDLLNSLRQAKDSKKVWEAINRFKGKAAKLVGHVQINDWITHFKQLLDPPLLSARMYYAEPLIVDGYLDREFSIEELKLVLCKMKNNKAPGADGIPYEFYKNSSELLLSKLLHFYNLIFINNRAPQSFKRSVIYPLFKKGDPNVAQNYRGLSFIDCVAKIYSSLLHDRLNAWVNERDLLVEYQAGFRKGYSTIDNIFTLSNLVKLRLNFKRGKLFCFFVDFKAAFDTIDRRALFYKLSCLGVSTRMI
jgi:hypothetical protein